MSDETINGQVKAVVKGTTAPDYEGVLHAKTDNDDPETQVIIDYLLYLSGAWRRLEDLFGLVNFGTTAPPNKNLLWGKTDVDNPDTRSLIDYMQWEKDEANWVSWTQKLAETNLNEAKSLSQVNVNLNPDLKILDFKKINVGERIPVPVDSTNSNIPPHGLMFLQYKNGELHMLDSEGRVISDTTGINAQLLKIQLQFTKIGEPVLLPEMSAATAPLPPSGYRYSFLDTDTGAMVTVKSNGSKAYHLDGSIPSSLFIGTMGQSNMVGKDGNDMNPDYPFYVPNAYYWNGDRQQMRTNRPPAASGAGSMMNYLCSHLLTNPHIKEVTEVCGANGGAGIMEVSGSSTGNNWSATGNLRSPFLADLQSYEAFAQKGPDFILFQGLEQEGSWIAGETDRGAAKSTAKAAMADVLDWVFLNYPDTTFVFNELGTLATGDTTAWTYAREIATELADEYVGGRVILGSQLPKTLIDDNYFIDRVHWTWQGYQIVGEDTAEVILNDLITG